MTGPEHYQEAESLLAVERNFEHKTSAERKAIADAAQVHATLALAAATALQKEGGGVLPAKDRKAWFEAASEHKTGIKASEIP
jgi:hypothetical protein